ncbi:MAG TPA: potassium-transporting ATPase subunit KdpC [Candidatus Binatia bacterium]|nr:potassium-transporting ATPase subunit KdpC [Candidatus Binatia bacterium]
MKEIKTAVLMLAVMTLITGVAYPLVVTAIAQLAFPSQANGSLITRGDEIVGSSLVGQGFTDPKYFWSRGSATSRVRYDAAASLGSNAGPLNPSLDEAVSGRVKALVDADPEHRKPVPIDLATASGSGLDPHVTPAGARYQVARVARARGLDPKVVQRLVDEHTEGRQLGFLGEARVNVLQLNLALDALPR